MATDKTKGGVMGRLKKRAGLAAAIVAATTLGVGVIGFVVPSAGAAARPGSVFRLGSPQIHPSVTAVGTYPNAYVNGTDVGALVISSDGTFTWAVDGGDSGTWVSSGKSFAMEFTGGEDGSDECVFSATIYKKSLAKAAKPGNWACAAEGSTGTWYATK
jgi:hypothetical protein